MIDKKQIEERKAALEKDSESMRELVEKLDNEKASAIARITALSGAIQQCDQFLQQLDKESDVGDNADSSIPTKKNKK
jgi:prephenate dehydratase|tara:strand:+ start:126 stop:359 length:234 start_codon:yes stop_codon:yes gene_type:complete